MISITLEQIQCLQAVSDFGSLNAAAENLNKAKSAVSYSILRLDEQLGFATLDRSQYRIQLTPQGLAFLDKAKILLSDFEKLKVEVEKIRTGVETKISLSATAIFPTQVLNDVLKKLMNEFPSTEFTFHREILSGEKMLMNQQVDIAIFESLVNSLDLEAKKIGKTTLKLVISSTHPFLKKPKKDQTLETLIEYPHIIQRSTIPDERTVGIHSLSKRWTVSDIDSKKDLILNNLGWGRLPDHFIEKELKGNQLKHLHYLNYDHVVDIYLSRRKDKASGPVLDYIWNSF